MLDMMTGAQTMKSNQKTPLFWTAVVVYRGERPAYIAAQVSWDKQHDMLTCSSDSSSRMWHRRGARLFETRKECIRDCHSNGYFPMG